MKDLIYRLIRFFDKSIPNGLTEVWHSSEDFLLSSIRNLDEVLASLPQSDNAVFHWNQYKYTWSKAFCTWVAPISIIASIFNKSLSDDDIYNYFEYAKTNYWYKEWEGNSLRNGVDSAVKRWNEKHPMLKVLYFRSSLRNTSVDKVLKARFWVVVWYKGNSAYNTDKRDTVLAWTSFWDPTYWHATTLYTSHIIVDSNKWAVDDMYKIMDGNLPKLLDNGVFYEECYVILPENATYKLDSRKENLKQYLLNIRNKRLSQ